MRNFIDIVFHGDDPREMTFVEVEDENGRSVCLGEWVERQNGYSALRLTPSAFEPEDPTLWCWPCGAPTKRQCKCPPIPAND